MGKSVNGRGPDTGHESSPGKDPRNHADFIWSVADLLRGDNRQSEYGKVILPLTVLRWLAEVLVSTKQQVLERNEQLHGRLEKMDSLLISADGER